MWCFLHNFGIICEAATTGNMVPWLTCIVARLEELQSQIFEIQIDLVTLGLYRGTMKILMSM